MTLSSILKIKSSNKEILISEYLLEKNPKYPIGLINIKSELINKVLFDALKILPANFIIIWNNSNFWDSKNISFSDVAINNEGLDFIVCDDCEKNIIEYFKNGIIPIIYNSNHISGILTEFNASKVEWNAFIFESNVLCDIYYAIIRYLENYKFPYDNKALVKNVLDI